jgi:internalin A
VRVITAFGSCLPSLAFALGISVLLALAGCSELSGPSAAEDPPLPVEVIDTDPPPLTPEELRHRLGANENAQFHLAGNEIVLAQLSNSGVASLEPLRGLRLQHLDIRGLPVADLSPLAGMPLEAFYAEESQVADLSPLKGLPLQSLWLNHTPVADLSPLAGMRFRELNLWATKVTDFSPLKTIHADTLWLRDTAIVDLSVLNGKPLVSLDLQDTAVRDLSPLANMASLKRLNLAAAAVTDLSPLAGLELERLIISPAKIERGLDAIRAMTSLQELDAEFIQGRKPLTPAEFWARYDASAFTSPKE